MSDGTDDYEDGNSAPTGSGTMLPLNCRPIAAATKAPPKVDMNPCREAPMPATEPSIFCTICVSISVGAAPGSDTVTSTKGKEMSGFWLMGKRKKATRPMKAKTTNRTSGGTG